MCVIFYFGYATYNNNRKSNLVMYFVVFPNNLYRMFD